MSDISHRHSTTDVHDFHSFIMITDYTTALPKCPTQEAQVYNTSTNMQ